VNGSRDDCETLADLCSTEEIGRGSAPELAGRMAPMTAPEGPVGNLASSLLVTGSVEGSRRDGAARGILSSCAPTLPIAAALAAALMGAARELS
jgi:hypothetical protein